MYELMKRFRKSRTAAPQESGKAYYDEAFSSAQHWQEHYTRSSYYFIWTVLVDRLRRIGSAAVLEIGCGPGQLAAAIQDAGLVKSYVGVDFSDVAVGFARKACPPEFVFRIEDATESSVFETARYDVVISTEFLEHVEKDLEVLGRIRPGARLLATVPNFPYVSHVRHFRDVASVEQRYGPLFRQFSIAAIPGVQPNTCFFLMEGEKR